VARRSTLLALLAAVIGCPSQPPSAAKSHPRGLAPNQIARTVEPPFAASIDRDALSALSPAARERVAASRVPVLVPRDPRFLAGAAITAEEYFFAFSGSSEGAWISVHGTRLEHDHGFPPIKGHRTVRSASAFVTEVERVREASWLEGGASYVLDVECERRDDPRCATEQFLLDTAEGLVFVGPERGVGP
jgi:hypothetical protein